MSKALFGAMAMFYSVGAGAGGGGGALTPPVTAIGAAPQIQFGTTADKGFLENHPSIGTAVTDGAYYDGTQWIPTKTAAVSFQFSSTLPGFSINVNQTLTVGSPFSPTSIIWYFGPGNNLNFSPRIEPQAGALITGGTNPTTGDGMMLYGSAGLGQIVQKNWATGTLGQINIAGSTVNLQVGPTTSLTSYWTLGSAGQIDHIHASQTGAAESFYTATVSDDATATFRIKNASATNNAFLPNILTVGSAARQSRVETITATTDTGTVPCWEWYFDVGGGNVVTRPLWTINSIGNTLLYLIPLGTGNSAAFVWSQSGANAPTFTTRSAGTKLVLWSAIDGTHVDYAIGMGGAGPWISLPQASSTYTFQIYGGTTAIATFRGDGLVEAVGGFRATGFVVPSSGGTGVEFNISGGTALLYGYDRTGSAYIATAVRGLTVALSPNGTAAFTADTNRCTFASGVAYKTTVVTGAGPTTVAATDNWLVANPTVSAAATYNLPASPVAGEEHTFTDEKGIAAGSNITISGNGKNISGGTTATTEVIATNFGSRTLRFNGTNWNIIAKV